MPIKKGKSSIRPVKKKTMVKKRGRPRKKEVQQIEEQKKEIKKAIKRDYLFAVGRRKEAVSRVRYYLKKEGETEINSRKLSEFFPTFTLQQIVKKPLEVVKLKIGSFSIRVKGGGKRGQAESISLGIARVLEKYDSNLRSPLKKAGLLSRDARIKERKKYGLKRARRAPQWQKR